MTTISNISLFVLCVVLTITLSEGLKCYTCQSEILAIVNDDCAKGIFTEADIKECKDAEVCYDRKIKIEGTGRTIAYRGCENEKVCKLVTEKSDIPDLPKGVVTCTTCKTDLCNKNGGYLLQENVLMMGIVIAVVVSKFFAM